MPDLSIPPTLVEAAARALYNANRPKGTDWWALGNDGGDRDLYRSNAADILAAALAECGIGEVIEAIRRMMATNSRDWAEDRGDAFLWAVFLGWDADQGDDLEELAAGAMDEVAARHGWDEAQVARLRRFRVAIDALAGNDARLPASSVDTPREEQA